MSDVFGDLAETLGNIFLLLKVFAALAAIGAGVFVLRLFFGFWRPLVTVLRWTLGVGHLGLLDRLRMLVQPSPSSPNTKEVPVDNLNTARSATPAAPTTAAHETPSLGIQPRSFNGMALPAAALCVGAVAAWFMVPREPQKVVVQAPPPQVIVREIRSPSPPPVITPPAPERRVTPEPGPGPIRKPTPLVKPSPEPKDRPTKVQRPREPVTFSGEWVKTGLKKLPRFYLVESGSALQGEYTPLNGAGPFPITGTVTGNVAEFQATDGLETIHFRLRIFHDGVVKAECWQNKEEIMRSYATAIQAAATSQKKNALRGTLRRVLELADRPLLMGIFEKTKTEKVQ